MSLWNGEIRLHLVSPEPFAAKGWLADTLGVLEGADRFAPDTYAVEGGKPQAYDRAAALRRTKAALKTGNTLGLARQRPVTYGAEVKFLVGFQTHLVMVLPKAKRAAPDLAALFALADALALAVRADIGTLQPITGAAATDAHDRAGHHLPSILAKAGLVAPTARCWLGPRVVGLAPPGALAGADLRDLGGGLLRLDLVADPWTADLAALEAARARVEPPLRATGLLATEVGATGADPGPAWVPLPPQPMPD